MHSAFDKHPEFLSIVPPTITLGTKAWWNEGLQIRLGTASDRNHPRHRGRFDRLRASSARFHRPGRAFDRLGRIALVHHLDLEGSLTVGHRNPTNG